MYPSTRHIIRSPPHSLIPRVVGTSEILHVSHSQKISCLARSRRKAKEAKEGLTTAFKVISVDLPSAFFSRTMDRLGIGGI